MIPTTLGVVLVIFTLYHLAPGDPALVMMGDQSGGSAVEGSDAESKLAEFRRRHGLDRSFLVQFFDYVGPFNLSPNGHPWFDSPRTERVTQAELVTDPKSGLQRSVDQGVPVRIEHLFETPQDERERLDRAVATLCDDAPADVAADVAWAAAGVTLAASGARRAEPALLTALFERRIVAPAERAAVARVLGALAMLHGAEIDVDPVLLERDGEQHRVRRCFARYYAESGSRAQNSGEDKWGGLLALELGSEMQSRRSVAKELALRLRVTVPLAFVSALLSYLLALPLGIFSARRRGRRIDGAVTSALFVLYSIPTFWAGLMLILIFGATGLDWLPVLGLMDKDWESFSALHKVLDVGLHCVLPVVTLTYGSLAYLSRQMRAGMLDVLQQDYIRTARAKGLSEGRVIYKHALRNSMIPVLTLMASILPVLIGGSVIVEKVFNLPGMGSYAFEGLLRRDFNIVMATTLLGGVMTQLGILMSDVTYSLVDPRIRLG